MVRDLFISSWFSRVFQCGDQRWQICKYYRDGQEIQNYFREFCAFQVITRNPIKELRNDKNIPHLAFLLIQATWTLITKKSTIDFHFQSHNWRWNIVLIFSPLKRYCVLSVWISDISMHLLLLMQSRAEIEFLYLLWDIKYPHFPPFFIRNIFVGYKVSAPLTPTKTLHIERTNMVQKNV